MTPASCWRKRGVNSHDHEGELTVAPDVLDALPLRGCLITADALYCQRSLCQTILDQQGDYLLIVKENQPELWDAIAFLFAAPPPGETFGFAQTCDQHGDRIDTRRLWASPALAGYLDWPGIQQVLKIQRVWEGASQTGQQVRYAITSQGSAVGPATLLAQVRGHWAIENRLHYVRDVSMGEDGSQVRADSAPEVMAGLRNVVLGILRSAGWQNIAEGMRHYAWHPSDLYALLSLSTA